MKKYKLLMFLILIFIPVTVFGQSVNIDKLESDLAIQKNGDYKITENFEFSGPEKNSGVYRNIYYENSSGISDLKIFAEDKELKAVNKASKGDKYVYTAEDDGKELKIKAYIPWNKKLDIKYQYTLKDAAIYGTDTGIFSYNFISKLDTNIDSFSAEVKLDGYDFSREVIVDPESAQYSTDGGILTIKASGLSDDSFVSANAEIPLSLIPESHNRKDVSFSDIEKNRQTPDSGDITNISPIVFIIEAVVLVLSFFYMKKAEKTYLKGETLGHIMPLSPSEASSFLFGNNQSANFIYATILDWTNSGYFTISTENYRTKKNKENVNYIFKRTDKTFSSLSDSEEFLLNNILLKGSDTFSTRDLNTSRINGEAKFNEQFTKYLGILDKELRKKNLKPDTYKYLFIGLVPFLLSILFFVVSIVEAMFSLPLAIAGIAMAAATFIISLKIMGTQTALQKEQRDFYTKLYKSLKENDKIDNYSEEEKEKLIIYSIAFGLKYERIKEIQETSGIDTDIFLPVFWMTFIGGSSLTKEINRSFVGNENGVAFGGGAFSGFSGGTGSTGGGSAGGF